MIEKAVKLVYNNWKSNLPLLKEEHPSEEQLANLLESNLDIEQTEYVRSHIVKCPHCAHLVEVALKMGSAQLVDAPPDLIKKVKESFGCNAADILDVILQVKNNILEIIHSAGDILVDQELVPAALLRSRKIAEFKDEVTMLKDFNDVRVQLKIENKLGKSFNLIVIVKDKQTQALLKDVRISLSKDDIELESYLVDSGTVTFENVLLGKYSIELTSSDSKVATIIVDIKH